MMKMRFGILITSVLVLGVRPSSAADTATSCDETRAGRVSSAVLKNRDWDDVYHSFNIYKNCEGENVVEAYTAYSEVISNLLANDWSTFPRLVKLSNINPKFELFVIKHVEDETIPQDVLRKIEKNAQTTCPRFSDKLCKRLLRATLPVEGATYPQN